jgi:hypothetical protein
MKIMIKENFWEEINMNRTSSRTLGVLAFTGLFCAAFPGSAMAYTYTVDPGQSNLTLSGAITSTVTSTYWWAESGTSTNTSTGTVALTPISSFGGSPGNLSSALTGSLDATLGSGGISFSGGAGFSNQSAFKGEFNQAIADLLVRGGVETGSASSPVFDYNLNTYSPGLVGNVTGSAALSGAAGNQTFFTVGLAGNWLAPATMMHGFSYQIQSRQNGDSWSQPLPANFLMSAGVGTLVNDGMTETLTLPFLETVQYSWGEGPVTQYVYDSSTTTQWSTTVTYTLSGQVVAVRAVPEPEVWGSMLVGLAVVGGVSAKRRRIR